MLRLAGEIADGVVLWLCIPEYIRDVVVPTVAEGRAKAGKPADGFDIVAAVPSAVMADTEQAKAQLRAELIPYFSLPFYRKMIEGSGFGDDLAAFDRESQERHLRPLPRVARRDRERGGGRGHRAPLRRQRGDLARRRRHRPDGLRRHARGPRRIARLSRTAFRNMCVYVRAQMGS